MRIPIINLRTVKRKGVVAYQLDYALNGKRIREIVAHDKRSAEIVKAKRQEELRLGIHGLTTHSAKIISLSELIQKFLNNKLGIVQKSTHGRYVNYFTGFERFMLKYFPSVCDNIQNIKPYYLQECFQKLNKEPVNKKKPWHQSSINILRDLSIEMFDMAVKEKYREDNPVSQTQPFKISQSDKIRFFSTDELEILWQNLNPFWIPFFKFLLFTGIRRGEIINLLWSNVSLNEKKPSITVTSTEEHRTKGGKTQTITISEAAFEILNSQKGRDPKYVFVDEKGRKIRKSTPNEVLKKAIPKDTFFGTPHMFRHTFAANFLMNNVGTIYDLSKFLSHSDIETTQIYAHLSPEYMKGITDKLNTYQK